MNRIQLATECKIPCSGTAEGCGFQDAIQRLDKLPTLPHDQAAVILQIGAWCTQVAAGLEAAANFPPSTTDSTLTFDTDIS